MQGMPGEFALSGEGLLKGVQCRYPISGDVPSFA
jgi:hypothetical protein